MINQPLLHIEIPTLNPGSAGEFYGEVFGWKIETNQEHNYVTFQSEGGLRGGFAGASEPTYKAGELLLYLPTEDIDATLTAIEAHGGKTLHPRTVIPKVLSWAIFADPAGNRVGLFTRHSAES
jgi:predicted enzyme related to lactoylglutathione lyase